MRSEETMARSSTAPRNQPGRTVAQPDIESMAMTLKQIFTSLPEGEPLTRLDAPGEIARQVELRVNPTATMSGRILGGQVVEKTMSTQRLGAQWGGNHQVELQFRKGHSQRQVDGRPLIQPRHTELSHSRWWLVWGVQTRLETDSPHTRTHSMRAVHLAVHIHQQALRPAYHLVRTTSTHLSRTRHQAH